VVRKEGRGGHPPGGEGCKPGKGGKKGEVLEINKDGKNSLEKRSQSLQRRLRGGEGHQRDQGLTPRRLRKRRVRCSLQEEKMKHLA